MASDLAKRPATNHRNTELLGRRKTGCRVGSIHPKISRPASRPSGPRASRLERLPSTRTQFYSGGFHRPLNQARGNLWLVETSSQIHARRPKAVLRNGRQGSLSKDVSMPNSLNEKGFFGFVPEIGH